MNDPSKIDDFLKTSLTPADAPNLSPRFEDGLQARLARQRLGHAERRRLNLFLLVSTLASVAVMGWLAIPWWIILPAVLVPATLFVFFQRVMWPKSGN